MNYLCLPSYELPPASAGRGDCCSVASAEYKKAASIKKALAEALRNYAFSFFG
jgi:hypothetical protein